MRTKSRTLDMGCYRRGQATTLYVSRFSPIDVPRTVYSLRVLDPAIDGKARVEFDMPESQLRDAFDFQTDHREIAFTYLCKPGVLYLEFDPTDIEFQPMHRNGAVQVKVNGEGLFAIRFQQLTGRESETVSFDFGNAATKCAAYDPAAPGGPATDRPLGAAGSLLPCRLYALAFADVRDLEYVDNSISYVTTDQLTELEGVFKHAKEPGVALHVHDRLDLRQGPQTSQATTIGLPRISLIVDGFKARIGTLDGEVSQQKLDFTILNRKHTVRLVLADPEYQNQILIYQTRVFHLAMPVSRYVYSLPRIKVIAKDETTVRDAAFKSYGDFVTKAAEIVNPSVRCLLETASEYYEEGVSAAAYYATRRYHNLLRGKPGAAVERLVVVEMGAGHTHIIQCTIDPRSGNGGPVVSFAADAKDGESERALLMGSLAVAGEYLTLGPYYHRMIQIPVQRPGTTRAGDGDVLKYAYNMMDDAERSQRLLDMEGVFHMLEAIKRTGQAPVPPDVGRLIRPPYPDNLSSQYKQEISRGALQLLRSVFFTGVPSYEVLKRRVSEADRMAGASNALTRSLVLGFRHVLAEQGDFLDRLPDDAGEERRGDAYRDFVGQYFFVDEYPAPVGSIWREDELVGVVSLARIIDEYVAEVRQAPEDARLLVIQFSGGSSQTPGLVDWTRELVDTKLHRIEEESGGGLKLRDRVQVLAARNPYEAVRAVSHGTIYRYAANARGEEFFRFPEANGLDEPGP